MPRLQLKNFWKRLTRDKKGAVAVIFGLSILPLSLGTGLAIDYASYECLLVQLNGAADAAAMQTVRVASQSYSANPNQTSNQALATGKTAGMQWFAAQAGSYNATLSAPVITPSYSTSPSQFTAKVSYTGTTPTTFGSLIGLRTLPVSGTASAVIGNSYVEVGMLLDVSGSMLIGSTPADIAAMEKATPCSNAANYENNQMDGIYAWLYSQGVGYSYFTQTAPPSNTVNGNCDPRYTGDSSACLYVANINNISSSSTWFCNNGGGKVQVYGGTTYYLAQAPCAFACHDRTDGNDYYALIRKMTNPKVTLRVDVVQTAAQNVIATLKAKQTIPNQFSVALTTFHNQNTQIYPTSGESGTDLTAASNAAGQMTANQPVTTNANDTSLNVATYYMTQQMTASGNGQSPSSPLKNVFIVTDGMQNYTSMGPMTDPNNETVCKRFWDLGINVYVLYTPYTPLVHNQYLTSIKQYNEPAAGSTADSPNVAALKACARYPGNFFVASDPAAINTAMQNMLASALNSPGRITQ